MRSTPPRRFWLACIASVAALACGGPMLMIPGSSLRGEVVTEPVSDWSFASDRFVDLETRPADPYSVELNYIVRDGLLYLDPAEGRVWLDHLRAAVDRVPAESRSRSHGHQNENLRP